jgi:hypothetical protein
VTALPNLFFTRLAAAVVLSLAMQFAAAPAWPQEQRSSPTPREQGAHGGNSEEAGQSEAPVAHVGAGTTDGSTTGYSGPEDNAQAQPGEVSVPPLPSADVCEPYRDTPAYQSCLWVVLRDETGEPADE